MGKGRRPTASPRAAASTAPRPGELAGGADQLVDDAGLGHGVAGIADDAKIGLRPGAREVPGVLDWGDDIVAAVRDDAGQVTDALDAEQQLIVALEETAIDEVVALDAGKGDGVGVGPEQ